MTKPNPTFPGLPNQAWWLWVPVISLAFFLLVEVFVPEKYYGYFVNENGIVETLHGLIMAFGAVLAFKILCLPEIRQNRFLSAWFGIGLLGCIYVAGEEISWGQHIIGWGTPEYWQSINDQQETNLHNVSSWLDQKPRLMLEIGVIVGGLILPALLKFRPRIVPDWLKTITPPAQMAVTATAFLFVKIFDQIGDFSDFKLFGRASEIGEYFIHYFVALYLLVMLLRFRSAQKKPGA